MREVDQMTTWNFFGAAAGYVKHSLVGRHKTALFGRLSLVAACPQR